MLSMATASLFLTTFPKAQLRLARNSLENLSRTYSPSVLQIRTALANWPCNKHAAAHPNRPD